VKQDDGFNLSRRKFLRLGSIAALAGIFPCPALSSSADLSLPEKSLAFYNTHTGEQLITTYWVQGNYMEDSLAEINRVLRDHRTNEIKNIDTTLLDLLFGLRNELATQEPFHVISGYRSPETNALLRGQSSGVAVNSLHRDGKAIDIRTPGRALEGLRNAAVAMKAGGVGYYPKSDFVHIDVGRVRYW
jgi:uncharacterized protein YcbK (DUF882 family)